MEDKKVNSKKERKSASCLQRCAWVAEIVTSIALAFFAGLQFYDAYNKHIEEKLLQQPIFQIRTHLWKSEGSEVKDFAKIEIYNVGEKVKTIDDIDIRTYLEFEYTPKIGQHSLDTFYIPIRNYFDITYTTYNVDGLIAYTDNYYPNNGHVGRLNQETIHNRLPSEGAFVRILHITSIDYTDKLDKSHRIIFLENNSNQVRTMEKIKKKSEEAFSYHMWSIDELTLEKIKEICGIKPAEK